MLVIPLGMVTLVKALLKKADAVTATTLYVVPAFATVLGMFTAVNVPS